MHKFSVDMVREIVINCTSLTQVCYVLGYKGNGGFKRVRTLIISESIDVSHFSHNIKKQPRPRKIPISTYLDNIKSITSLILKQRLLEESILKYRCNRCKLSVWLEEPIPLQLHHIDGTYNNNLSNLELLCPTCHSKTNNYGSKNIHKDTERTASRREYSKEYYKKIKERMNAVLESSRIQLEVIRKPTITKPRSTKIIWPNNEILQLLLWEKPTRLLAKDLGVSDTAIAKRAKLLGLTKPSRGYWEKKYHTKL